MMHLFIDDEAILAKLSEKGNPLEGLDKVIDWSQFQPVSTAIFSNTSRNRTKGGRYNLDFMMMFQLLLLQRLHNLSDDAVEYHLLDRLSFVALNKSSD